MLHENTVDYILGELSKQHRYNEKVSKFATSTDEAITMISKALISLKKFNKGVSAFTVACIICGYFGVKKIKELEKEIKELRKLKGE